MEKVSLYVPCYNAEKTIGDCLDSVMKQTYKIDEILVIDDGSEDKTVELAKRYPVRIISHEKNMGLAASRNTAFKQAKNEFVAGIDADCVADAEWLKQLMDCFVDDNIAGCGGMLIERYTSRLADAWRHAHMPQRWGPELLENPPFLYGSNNVFRKKAVEKAGFYDEEYRTNYEDVEISARIYNCGLKLIYNPWACVEHLRKDTISSVLSSYCNWLRYKYAASLRFNQFFGRIILAVGRAAEYADISENFVRQDVRTKCYRLLPIDLFCIINCIWMNLKYSLKGDVPFKK